MSCNCNHSNHANGMTIRQGESFSLVFQYNEDDTAMALPQGYDLLVGIYDTKGNVLKSATISGGGITANANATYTMPITHEESMNMLGKVTIELTIFNDGHTVVDHASDVVVMTIEPRRNNALL